MPRPVPRSGTQARGRVITPQRLRSRFRLLLLGMVVVLGGFVFWLTRANPSHMNGARPIATLSTDDAHALLWSPGDSNIVFFGHHDGLLRSIDGGRTWQATSLADADAMSVSATPKAPERMYVAGHGIFRRSDDGGTTWTTPNSPLQGADIHGFAQSPADPDRLYALVVGQGIVMSTDGGTTWTQRAQAAASHAALVVNADGTTLLMGGPSNRVQQSADDGATWTRSGSDLPPGAQVLALAVGPDGAGLFAGTTKGLYRRTSPDAPWEPTPLKEPILAVAVNFVHSNVVLAINEHQQVLRSDNGGATWTGATQ